jgi:hypothetical protein
MKKVLLLLAVAGAGYICWQRFSQDREDRDLWAEVTDTFE